MVLAALIFAAFFAFCVSVLWDGAPATRRFPHEYVVFVMAFGAVCSTVMLGLVIAELFNPTRLVITAAGITQIGLRKLSPIPWEDIEKFVIHRQGVNRHLGYQLTAGARSRRAQGWRRWVTYGTSDGLLVSGPGRTPGQLLELLRERHRLAGLRSSAEIADQA